MSAELEHLAEAVKILRGGESRVSARYVLEPVELPTGRMQTPSQRAIRAVEIYAENGGNKGDALREAGYSEEVATNPHKVFGTPTVQAIMAKIGLGESHAITAIKRAVDATSAKGAPLYHYQLQAADMILKIVGGYAPKRVEGKHDHKVGIFSMKDLREKMRQNGRRIIIQDEV